MWMAESRTVLSKKPGWVLVIFVYSHLSRVIFLNIKEAVLKISNLKICPELPFLPIL
jgi:hypothetical protein